MFNPRKETSRDESDGGSSQRQEGEDADWTEGEGGGAGWRDGEGDAGWRDRCPDGGTVPWDQILSKKICPQVLHPRGVQRGDCWSMKLHPG